MSRDTERGAPIGAEGLKGARLDQRFDSGTCIVTSLCAMKWNSRRSQRVEISFKGRDGIDG